MQTTVFVDSDSVQVRHYDAFSVVEIADGVMIHFSSDGDDDGDPNEERPHEEAAEFFANRITNPNSSTMDSWLTNVDLRVDGSPERQDNPLTHYNY